MAYSYEMTHPFVIETSQSERARFIRRTYAHLAGAILAFVAIEAFVFGFVRHMSSGFDQMMLSYFRSPGMGIVLMLAFMGSSYLAQYWAMQGGSRGLQYAGLGLYVVIEAVIFVPLLYVAMVLLHDTAIVAEAGILTMCIFAGLTAAVFISGKDFGFLGPIIMIASFLALGFILCAWLFGFGLGLWFSLAMCVLASGSILYNTSNILLRYRLDQHVAAALGLFASVAMLFYYVLLALLQSRR